MKSIGTSTTFNMLPRKVENSQSDYIFSSSSSSGKCSQGSDVAYNPSDEHESNTSDVEDSDWFVINYYYCGNLETKYYKFSNGENEMHMNGIEQELTAEAGSKPLDEARNTVMATAAYRK